MTSNPVSRRHALRSWLFVPADSEKKMIKAETSGADALILDLEDSVAANRRDSARSLLLHYLSARPDRSRQQLWVRINPLSTPDALRDLIVVAGAPDGLMLPKVGSASDVVRLAHMLDALEVRENIATGRIGILPVATEMPAALFTLGSYAGCSERLAGITWGAEDLAAALGGSTNRRADGEYEEIYGLARSLCLSGAAAADVQPIDTIWADFRDSAGLEHDSQRARRLGFTGKMAIHPAQVEIINAAFRPGEEEVAWARRVVAAFSENPGAGTLALDGKMLDMPHLKQAHRVLALADRH